MKIPLSILMLSISLVFAPACDDGNDDGDKKSDKDDKNNDDDDDGGDDDKNNDDDDVPLWDCYCEAECDGDFIEFEEEVCSDAESLDIAIEIATDECAEDLSGDCVDFYCGCECDEDPDLVCG